MIWIWIGHMIWIGSMYKKLMTFRAW